MYFVHSISSLLILFLFSNVRKMFLLMSFQLIFHRQKITLFQLCHNSEIPSRLIDAGQFFTGVTKD